MAPFAGAANESRTKNCGCGVPRVRRFVPFWSAAPQVVLPPESKTATAAAEEQAAHK